MWDVKVNLYDLSQGLAKGMSQALIGKQIEGIWHTGVVVYGYEYYFSGGIQKDPAGQTAAGTPMRVIPMGQTSIDQRTFEQYLSSISPRFTIATYRLLEHNCNNFSDEVCKFLVGQGIPSYIVDLPREVMSTPLGQQLKPFIDNLYQGGNPLQNIPGTSMFGPDGASQPAPAPDSPTPTLQSATYYTYESINLATVYERLFANADQFKQTLESSSAPSPEPNPKQAGVLTQDDRDLLNSDAVKTWFNDICKDPKKRVPAPENAIPRGIITIITRLRCTWPKELLLPVFDIMRLIALHHKGAETLCKEPSVPSAATPGARPIYAPLSIVTLFKDYVLPAVGDDGDAPSAKLPPKAGAKLMCGRTAVNLFATEVGSKFMVTEPHLSLFIQGAVSLLAEKQPVLIQAGACLLQNICLSLGPERESAGELNEMAIAPLATAMSDAADKATEALAAGATPSLATLKLTLLALGTLLKDNEIGIAIFSSMDDGEGYASKLIAIHKNSELEESATIAGEICYLLGLN